VRRVAPSLDRDGLLAVVDELWTGPVFDRRLAAAMLLDARADLLRPIDLALLERLIRASHTWALVDVLAGDVAGAVLVRHPEAAGPPPPPPRAAGGPRGGAVKSVPPGARERPRPPPPPPHPPGCPRPRPARPGPGRRGGRRGPASVGRQPVPGILSCDRR